MIGFGIIFIWGCVNNPKTAQEKYTKISEVPSVSQIDHENYLFSLIPVSKVLKSLTWQRYAEVKEPRNTILLSGIPGYSYALSVIYKSNGIEKAKLVQFAASSYPTVSFSLSPDNDLCLASAMETPVRLSVSLKADIAFCHNPKTNDVYELVLSKRSMIEEADVSEMSLAMKQFVASFRFK